VSVTGELDDPRRLSEPLRDRGGAERALSSAATRRYLPIVLLAAAASALLHVVTGAQLSAPWITPDELIYSELAKSIADGSLPSVRGEATLGYGLVYPLTIAPAWALFDDPAHAYAAAKVINAFVMSLAAVPAFFLAHRFVSPRSAALVGAFSVFIPSMLLSGTLLIEVVLYPVFLVSLLGIVASIQRPTRRNQVLAVAGIALACLAKPLCVILVPAYVLAVVHLGLVDRRSGGSALARVRQHSTALGILGGVAALALVGSLATANPDAILGIYGVVLGHVDLSGTLVWFVRHLAGLDLYVALVPFAATLVLICQGARRGVEPRVREFGAVAVWTIGGTLLAIAAYSSKPLAGAAGYIPSEARLHERNMFVLVPLLLIGMALFVERRQPDTRWLRVSCLTVAVVLPFFLPLERLLYNATFQALVVIPWTAGGIERFWPLTFLPLAAIAAAVMLGSQARLVRRSWTLVGIVFAITTLAAHSSMTHPNGGASSTLGIGYDTRWIDRAVPSEAEVTALWLAPQRDDEEEGSDAGARTIWMSEFYNRSLGRVVEVGEPMPYDLPHIVGNVTAGVLRGEGGEPLSADYLLAPCWARVEGEVVASDARVEARVYRIPRGGPVHIERLTVANPRCPAG
jgi:hypothetical protein